VQPIFLGDARVQTVCVDNVAQAVVQAIDRSNLTGRDFDLVEPEAHNLLSIVLGMRRWLGFPEPSAVLRVPKLAGQISGFLADVAGWFGWRSPLRSTALRVLTDDVVGDPRPWREATGQTLMSFGETLQALPSTRQERIFARTQLVFPFLVFGFSVFWILSGLIGLWRIPDAMRVIEGSFSGPTGMAAVVLGALADIAIGFGLLFRPMFVLACQAAIGVALAYLVMGTLFVPSLWADPLGPLVKILPVIGLALALIAMGEER
jgi:hypothetical protein